MKHIPVLLYHSVSDGPSAHAAPYTVTPAMFERQLDAVTERGFRCITASQLMDEMPNVEEGVAVITFDDGYLDTLSVAAPALAKRNLPSTVYITSGLIEGKGERVPGPPDPMMQWSQLNELESMNVEIGAHSHSHPHMDTLSSSALNDELVRPKDMIEDQLGHAIRSFAYPHGYCGPRVKRFTRDAGYDSGAGVRNALTHASDDRFNFARLMLMADTTFEQFEHWLDAVDTPVAIPGEALKTIGWRLYRRGKAIATRRPGSDYA